MLWLADGCEGGLADVLATPVQILRLFGRGALFIYSVAGEVRIEMRLS
jgi:hypothetical protein